MKKNALLIDDDSEILSYLREILSSLSFTADTASDCTKGEALIRSKRYDVIFCDIHLPKRSGIRLFEDLRAAKVALPPYIFVSGNADPEVIEKASRVNAIDVIQKPFSPEHIAAALKRLDDAKFDRIDEIIHTINGISGITLGPEKRHLVETRLWRRVRQLSMDSIEQYCDYFAKNRTTEIDELVSLMTTHTTHFFRESGHFDFLADVAFPQFVENKQSEIRIWSAASSSGEEAYSIAMSWLEFVRVTGKGKDIKFSVFGSDIDFNIIETAEKGIYARDNVKKINPVIAGRYFNYGKEDLKHLVRVKDEVHSLCRFKQINLIGNDFPPEKFDVIFLRNCLIYFKPDLIKKIATSLGKCLKSDGYFIIGHSESLTGLNLNFHAVGNSIYSQGTASKKVADKNIAANSDAAKSVSNAGKPIRVFSIDDSATIRKMLENIFSNQPNFKFIGSAENPTVLKKPITPDDVDVLTLDIHMPGMDGISYLKSIKKPHPPVVVLSSIKYEDGVDYFNCLDLGAAEYIEKPSHDLIGEGERIRAVVSAVATRNKGRVYKDKAVAAAPASLALTPKYTPRPKDLIVIGASTGGVDAIRILLEQFPKTTPPVLIVQHIPIGFSKTFADRLNQVCPIRVKEAVHDEIFEANRAYIAPGGKQMKVALFGGSLRAVITDDERVNRHKPSVDYLFDSVVELSKNFQVVAAILTGMGDDGARGLQRLKQAGAYTIGQDEESCVVYGMPKVAFDLGATMAVVPLEGMAYHIFKKFIGD